MLSLLSYSPKQGLNNSELKTFSKSELLKEVYQNTTNLYALKACLWQTTYAI